MHRPSDDLELAGRFGVIPAKPNQTERKIMKLLMAVLIACSATAGTICRAADKPAPAGEEIAMPDLRVMQKQMDDLFARKLAPQILAAEREKIEALLPREKADAYLKQFESGMKSATGGIMIEGGENAWLERAFRAGYQQKIFFQTAYMEGMMRAAEPSRP